MQITNMSDGKAGKPVAILSPFNADSSPRTLGGSWQDQVEIADDFDQENDELINSFYNSTIFPVSH